MNTSSLRKYGTGTALVAGGIVAGAILAGTLTANAETTPTPSPASPGAAAPSRPAETPLTGDVASKVRAAVLAKYPGATIDRLETDSDGTYEAHLTTAAGERLTAEVDKSYAVTGTEAGGRGGHGGRGPGGARPGETALTGDVASKVRAAALAKYPGATIERLETDSDGAYEAHLTTAAGEHLTVEVDKSYAVTGTEAGGHGGRHGHTPDAAAASPSASAKTS
jgi:hypothetical protein